MGQEILTLCPVSKFNEIFASEFERNAWDFHNWIKSGYLHLTLQDFENIDLKLMQGFQLLAYEFGEMDKEKAEMQALGQGKH